MVSSFFKDYFSKGYFLFFVLILVSSAPAFAQSQQLERISPDFIFHTQKGTQEYTGQGTKGQKGFNTENAKPQKKESKRNGSISFVLKGVELNRSKFLSKELIEKTVRPFIGRVVHFNDLQILVNDINKLYKKKNILTAVAILPPQTVSNGFVRIELVEGRIGKVTIENNKYTSSGFINKRIPLKISDVIDVKKLNRDIVFFNRTTDLNLRAKLTPGRSFGQTNVGLYLTEPKRTSWQVFADDYGSESTGKYEIGTSLRRYGLLGVDDNLSAYLVHAENDNIYGTAAYSLVVNRQNGRLGLSGGRNQIRIINGPYGHLGINGESNSASINLDQPLIATQSWKLSVIPGFSYTHSRTKANSFQLSNITDYEYSLGADFSWFFGRGMLVFSPQAILVKSHEEFGRGRNLLLTRGGLYGYSFLNENWQIALNSAYQWAGGKGLPPAVLFQIGGVNSLRAYEPGILSGDNGYFVQLELHRRISRRVDGFLFADSGAVWSFQSEDIADSGLGCNIKWKSLSLNMTVGYAFKKVVDNQSLFRANVRLTWNIF